MGLEYAKITCSFCKRIFKFTFFKEDYTEGCIGFKTFKEALPYLSETQLELLRSGICPKCYAVKGQHNKIVRVPLYFSDLTSEMKEKLLGAFKTTLKDENWDKIPIIILERHIVD